MAAFRPPRVSSFEAEFRPPGDKSIAHRSILLGAIAGGASRLRGLPRSGDVLRTAAAVRALGCRLEWDGGDLVVHPPQGGRLREPDRVLSCGNSGTTLRLLAGFLAPSPFLAVLTGDASLRRRPMDRVVVPLRRMGARIRGRGGDRFPPLVVRGGTLKPLDYRMPLASAQVKSALLLAGLRGGVEVTLRGGEGTRDHLERLLDVLGADIRCTPGLVVLRPGPPPAPLDLALPADPSTAAFFVVLALLVPGARLRVRDLLLNPARTGFLHVLARMGAGIEIGDRRLSNGEEVGTVAVRSGALEGTVVGGDDDVPSVNDEVPALAVAAARARGVTRFTGLADLRTKESDRIAVMVRNLRAIGVEVEERGDGFSVRGTGRPLRGTIRAFGDHRVAMAFSILGASPGVDLSIRGARSIAVSDPGFLDRLQAVAERRRELPG
jgi:3-phosphoshikimate 1-carboxyvinyltransferase